MPAPNLLAKPRPTIQEFFFMLFVGGMILGMITYTDVVLHDYYVRPIIGECHPGNQDDFCTERRQEQGLQKTAQIELGGMYWSTITVQIVVVFIVMPAIRLMIAKMAGRKLTAMTWFTAFLWGLTATGFILFGFEDYFYFQMKGEDVPDKLEWLNNTGLFAITKASGSDPLNVEKNDLILTMFIGGFVIVVFWLLAIYGTKRNFNKIGKTL